MNFLELLEIEWWGNNIEAYLIVLLLFAFYKIGFWIFRKFLLKKNTKNIFVASLSKIPDIFYTLTAGYLALESLNIQNQLNKIIHLAFTSLVIFQIISTLQGPIKNLLASLLKGQKKEETDETFIQLSNLIINIILWTIAILLILSNWGVNVSSVIAGLGIGGVAVALAVQNILGDVFSAFSIYIDKPFVIGDAIAIGDYKGTVKKIGLKSTRIQSVQGEEIVISNKELTSAKIQNFKKMEERKVSFFVTVSHKTSADKCKKIPEIIHQIFNESNDLKLEYIVLKEFGSIGLIYEITFYYPSADYKSYITKQNLLNLSIKEKFEQDGIEFAVQP
jgi:small-conductance mechanosensitive channel